MIFNTFWAHFVAYDKVRIWLYSFSCECFCFSTLTVQKRMLLSPIGWSWQLCYRWLDRCMCEFVAILSISFQLHITLCASTTLFYHSSVVLEFGTGSRRLLTLFLDDTILAICDASVFVWKLQWLSHFWKKPQDWQRSLWLSQSPGLAQTSEQWFPSHDRGMLLHWAISCSSRCSHVLGWPHCYTFYTLGAVLNVTVLQIVCSYGVEV